LGNEIWALKPPVGYRTYKAANGSEAENLGVRWHCRSLKDLTLESEMDDLKKTAQPDRSKSNMHEDHELKYWTKQLGVSKVELQKAVDKVGNSAAAVRKQLSTNHAQANCHSARSSRRSAANPSRGRYKRRGRLAPSIWEDTSMLGRFPVLSMSTLHRLRIAAWFFVME
jgi:hypothetical protein